MHIHQPGGELTAPFSTSPALQGPRSTVTDTQGLYAMRALPPFMARSTSARLAMLVSPAVVMASAP